MQFQLTQTVDCVSLGVVGHPPLITKTLLKKTEASRGKWEYALRLTFGKGFHPASLSRLGFRGVTTDLAGDVSATFVTNPNGDLVFINGSVNFNHINMPIEKTDTLVLCWSAYAQAPWLTFSCKQAKNCAWQVSKVEGHEQLFDAIRFVALLQSPWTDKPFATGMNF